MSEFPEPVPLEVSPVQKAASWRDNKNTLWLVRIGFALQFYIPALVCIWIIRITGTYEPKIVPRDDPYFADYDFVNHLYAEFFKFSIYTLILLFVQCTVFTLILRFAKLRLATEILIWLIVINILHSLIWCFIGWPLTLIRLAIPTILYIIAAAIESKKPPYADRTNTQADTP